jgi:CubicO group peptidase (beta-lactamase class C family)
MDFKNIESLKDFWGTLLIENFNDKLFSYCGGKANASFNISNNINTLFGTASVTKFFTALGIMTLIETEKLSLTDKPYKILNLNNKFENEITVQNLLNHTSGIGDYFDEEINDDFASIWINNPVYNLNNLEDFLPLFINLENKFEPGKNFSYCNSGYILLGYLIEKISGNNYFEFIEKILEELNLIKTKFYKSNDVVENLAEGYYYEDDQLKRNIFDFPYRGAPDGGIFSNVIELNKLFKLFFENKVVSKGIKEKMISSQVKIAEGKSYNYFYGLGIYILKDKNDNVISYYLEGEDPGYFAKVSFLPEQNIFFSILSNLESDIEDIFWDVIEISNN